MLRDACEKRVGRKSQGGGRDERTRENQDDERPRAAAGTPLEKTWQERGAAACVK
jgi:hypothetical protein